MRDILNTRRAAWIGFTGGCLCGNVRIVATGRPYGSAFVTVSTAADIVAPFHASAVFPQDAVTIEGETRDYAGRSFVRCGSSIFSRTADEIEVNLGSLDAPDQLQPTYEAGPSVAVLVAAVSALETIRARS